MDLSDEDVQQFAEADRSPGGQLDWWVKERQEWLGRVRGADAVSRGSELLIFGQPKRADDQAISPGPPISASPGPNRLAASRAYDLFSCGSPSH